MSDVKKLLINQFQSGGMLIEMLTADLSDDEYFKTPLEGANHVGWILGHIACTEDWAMTAIANAPQRIPQSTHELFKGGSGCIPDAATYPTRSELDEMFRNARTFTVEALGAFDMGRWDDPSPESFPDKFFPTLGSVWGMQATHQFWHLGQITVCRVALGKPRVFSGDTN